MEKQTSKKQKNTLVVEFNEKFKKANTEIGGFISITPPINEDYWVFRVKLYENQSIVAFPKFFTMGIGFAQEENWNTNLPYSSSAEEIYKHINVNKKYKEITKESCIEAINLIKNACEKFQKN